MSAILAISPSDLTDLPAATGFIWCGTTGDLAVIAGSTASGPVSTVIKGIPANQWVRMPVPITRVLATGTTALNIIGAIGQPGYV